MLTRRQRSDTMGVSCGGHLVLGVPSRRHCALRAVRFLRWLDETPFEVRLRAEDDVALDNGTNTTGD